MALYSEAIIKLTKKILLLNYRFAKFRTKKIDCLSVVQKQKTFIFWSTC